MHHNRWIAINRDHCKLKFERGIVAGLYEKQNRRRAQVTERSEQRRKDLRGKNERDAKRTKDASGRREEIKEKKR